MSYYQTSIWWNLVESFLFFLKVIKTIISKLDIYNNYNNCFLCHENLPYYTGFTAKYFTVLRHPVSVFCCACCLLNHRSFVLWKEWECAKSDKLLEKQVYNNNSSVKYRVTNVMSVSAVKQHQYFKYITVVCSYPRDAKSSPLIIPAERINYPTIKCFLCP